MPARKNFDLQALVRPNLRALQPYASARHEYSGTGIFLDANENAFGSTLREGYNRYPDPLQHELKSKIAALKGISPQQLFLGNGSDESIDLLIRAFCRPGVDEIVVMPPTYGMYAVCAGIHDATVREIPLTGTFTIDVDRVLDALAPQTKLIFVCSPNNPSANCMPAEEIEALLQAHRGLVILDEAYIDYAPEKSFVPQLSRFPNLVILQTFSKAWGLAALRLGMAIASPEVVDILNRIKPPYNIGVATQELALQALANSGRKDRMVQATLRAREALRAELETLPFVERVFPSDANFLLVKTGQARQIYQALLARQVIIRDRSQVAHPETTGCLRITVGTPQENRMLLDALREIAGLPARYTSAVPLPPRVARIQRQTMETDISLELDLDGSGRYKIETGLGFFDHMLAQLARHSGCDLWLHVRGDLHVDEHHTIEDTALALGQAFRQALGDKRGIERYGFVLPMDETLAQVALDFSGRSWLVWHAEFHRERIGDMPTEMFHHFFKSFSDAAGCNLHVKVEGKNEHHKIEAIFKAVGRAIKMAVRRDPQAIDHGAEIPSTKGSL